MQLDFDFAASPVHASQQPTTIRKSAVTNKTDNTEQTTVQKPKLTDQHDLKKSSQISEYPSTKAPDTRQQALRLNMQPDSERVGVSMRKTFAFDENDDALEFNAIDEARKPRTTKQDAKRTHILERIQAQKDRK